MIARPRPSPAPRPYRIALNLDWRYTASVQAQSIRRLQDTLTERDRESWALKAEVLRLRAIIYQPCSCGCCFANGATCASCGQPLKAST